MLGKKKILISAFIKDLNKELDNINKFRTESRKLKIEKLDCKKLASKIGVTATTISNLHTDSKFSLIYNIIEEIYNNYFGLFIELENKYNKEQDPDEPRFIYDNKFLMWELTNYWIEE